MRKVEHFLTVNIDFLNASVIILLISSDGESMNNFNDGFNLICSMNGCGRAISVLYDFGSR